MSKAFFFRIDEDKAMLSPFLFFFFFVDYCAQILLYLVSFLVTYFHKLCIDDMVKGVR